MAEVSDKLSRDSDPIRALSDHNKDDNNGGKTLTTEDSDGRYPKDILCDPCAEDKKSLKAEGYCVDCDDYLCLDCFRNHRTPRPCRNHVLKDRDNMPQERTATSSLIRDEVKCLVHKGQTLLYFCTSHNKVLCEFCKQIDHRQCQQQNKLVEISDDVLDLTGLKDVQDQLTALKTEYDINKKRSARNEDRIDYSYGEVIKQISKIKHSDIGMAKSVGFVCENMSKEIATLLERMNVRQHRLQSYLAMKRAKEQFEVYESTLAQVVNDNKTFEYMVCHDEKSPESDHRIIGPLEKRQMIEIEVKTDTDSTNCFISGIDMLPGPRLVIADRANSKIKVVNLSSKTVDAELKLDHAPYDLTVIDDNTIAVTTYNAKNILVVSISDTVIVKKTLDKSQFRYCQGITCSNDTLHVYVSYDGPSLLQKQDLEGTVKQTIAKANQDGSDKFDDVRSIAQGSDLNTIYLSDMWKNKVLRMTVGGEIITEFTHEQLNEPRGIAVNGEGRIFLCSRGSNQIFEISSDLSRGRILFDNTDGILRPHSITYSDAEHKLYIGSKNSNEIQVFLL